MSRVEMEYAEDDDAVVIEIDMYSDSINEYLTAREGPYAGTLAVTLLPGLPDELPKFGLDELAVLRMMTPDYIYAWVGWRKTKPEHKPAEIWDMIAVTAGRSVVAVWQDLQMNIWHNAGEFTGPSTKPDAEPGRTLWDEILVELPYVKTYLSLRYQVALSYIADFDFLAPGKH